MRVSASRRIYPFIIVFGILASCSKMPDQIVDDTGVEMALVPGGKYEMTILNEIKQERSVRSVNLNDYYIDIYEVTNQRYAVCVEQGGCVEPLNTMEYSEKAYREHPVIFVTWDMADSYCKWREARLPTKAEWEKAAADELEKIEYYWGDESPLCQVGSRLGAGIEERTDYDPDTQPVGNSPINTYGLYDMTGGMWEWVQDKYALDAYTSSPEFVSFLRMYRWSGYGPLYNRYLCSFRCARSP